MLQLTAYVLESADVNLNVDVTARSIISAERSITSYIEPSHHITHDHRATQVPLPWAAKIAPSTSASVRPSSKLSSRPSPPSGWLGLLRACLGALLWPLTSLVQALLTELVLLFLARSLTSPEAGAWRCV